MTGVKYDVRLHPEAMKAYRRLRGSVADRIAAAIDGLGIDPRPTGSVKLAGRVTSASALAITASSTRWTMPKISSSSPGSPTAGTLIDTDLANLRVSRYGELGQLKWAAVDSNHLPPR